MPDSSEALTASLRALSSFLLGEETPREALMQIACMGEAALPGAAATGLTLLSDGRPHTAVFTAETASEVDQLQYDEGDGPCDGSVVRIDSNRTDARWPTFSERPANLGKGRKVPIGAGSQYEEIKWQVFLRPSATREASRMPGRGSPRSCRSCWGS